MRSGTNCVSFENFIPTFVYSQSSTCNISMRQDKITRESIQNTDRILLHYSCLKMPPIEVGMDVEDWHILDLSMQFSFYTKLPYITFF